MKTLFPVRIALIIALFATAGSACAQSIEELKTLNVPDFAQRLTDQMTPRIPLSEEQIGPVHKINLNFAEQVLPVVNGPGDLNSMVTAIREFDDKRSNDLKVFLSAEQMRQVRQLLMENRKQLKQRYTEKHL